jgi:hypothetical protein
MNSLVPKNIDNTITMLEDAKILELFYKINPYAPQLSVEKVCEVIEDDNKREYEHEKHVDNFNALLTKRFPQKFPENPSDWRNIKLFYRLEKQTTVIEELTKKVLNLTNEVTELRNMIEFAPGGSGYEEAEAEFNGLRSINL